MSLCQWCRENAFGYDILWLLEKACMGVRQQMLFQHTIDQEPFYFWTSRPLHSGYARNFQRPFQSVNSSAEQGCVFCSLLVTAAKQSPPQHPDQCYFEGPLSLFPEIRDTIEAARERRVLADGQLQEFFDNLDPNWNRSSSYANVIQRAIRAGLSRESLLLAYKVDPTRESLTDDRREYSTGNPKLPLFPFPTRHRNEVQTANSCHSRDILPPPVVGTRINKILNYFKTIIKRWTSSQETIIKRGTSNQETVIKRGTSNQDDFDFVFTIVLNEPWDFATVTWPYKPSGPNWGLEPSNCYFRLYPIEPRHHWEGHVATTEEEVLRRVTKTWDETGSQPSPMSALLRDGNILKALLEDCTKNHTDCTPRADASLPSMLLRISGTIASPSLHLVYVNNVFERPVRYACLSYCWGGEQLGKTTTARLPTYLKNIDLSGMPKTIQDAVKVSSSLGLKYLWVDAYCIVQDSTQDKSVELGKMSSIYLGAYCTIAVMSANAATEGFLRLSNETADNVSAWNVDIESELLQNGLGRSSPRVAVLEMRQDYRRPAPYDEALLKRAWTLQEALLSPRLIMFFSQGQPPVLRCATRTVRSDGGFIPQIPTSINTLYNIKRAHRGQTAVTAHRHLWYQIVQEYSKRALTYSMDKLPALAGIVAELEIQGTCGTYHAGLWSETVKHDLLWGVVGKDSMFLAPEETKNRAAHQTYVGPSWSWVSRDHPVFYPVDYEEESNTMVMAVDIVPQEEALPNGAIKTAKITLSCPAKELQVPNDWNCDERSFFFDDEPRPLEIGKMWLLTLMAEEPYNNRHRVGIGVIEVKESSLAGEKLYRRLGMFQNGALEDGNSEKEVWHQRTFTLV
ncbi:hypothetical protein GJ744_003642 [Endocarpon pusillum]|uniref:Heterokaryon incompatibility domain-containing protein n=1 Tax=Endocarpon pusillum TaxID=364733 RepID=A0A8H7DZN8_9EURO|nr:hypothetical protein GJ744_003642 [Endocarpon pusillum]